MSSISLTSFARGSGCGCKIAPQALQQILLNQTTVANHKVLVGNSTHDDAAVYDIGNGQALIATIDFFTPIVDDPFLFGKIAATNALSDIYAMGGTPILALSVLGWPIQAIDVSIAHEVIAGALDICNELRVPIAGGHSIDNIEPIFGLSVNGIAPISCIKQNSTAQVNDVLFITKPLGVGILSTAHKKKILSNSDTDNWIQQLTTVNTVGTLLGKMSEVHAMTDVTGFGFIGHLFEMCEASNCSASIHYKQLPILSAILPFIQQHIKPDATFRNWNRYQSAVLLDPALDILQAFSVLPDPQTNGGLLIAVSEKGSQEVQSLLASNGLYSSPIGYITSRKDKHIYVAP